MCGYFIHMFISYVFKMFIVSSEVDCTIKMFSIWCNLYVSGRNSYLLWIWQVDAIYEHPDYLCKGWAVTYILLKLCSDTEGWCVC